MRMDILRSNGIQRRPYATPKNFLVQSPREGKSKKKAGDTSNYRNTEIILNGVLRTRITPYECRVVHLP